VTLAYVGLGSNLGDSVGAIRAALAALDAIPGCRVVARSHLYATSPWGRTDQPDFVNAVVALDTTLSARALLDELLSIERRAGRIRGDDRWGPRALDLDLLLYGQHSIAESGLQVPHPRLPERAFVLVPLAEIAPALAVPSAGVVADLLGRVDASGCRVLE
jgi:2-amino-4-hydroxy-6-hydroxymethyldihydropteridine diphosphokinase